MSMQQAAAEAHSVSAMEEWRRSPMLPIAGLIGHATAVFHLNGFAPFIIPVSESFGWSRTFTTFGLSIVLMIQAACAVPMGMLVDRIGSRRIGLVGLLSVPLAFGMVGLATTGDKPNWIILWLIMGLAALPAQSTIWTNAVSSRFHASRGMALGVSMCGTSVAIAILPWLGAVLNEQYGWHRAMMYEALIWILISYPFMFLFFWGAADQRGKKSAHRLESAESAPPQDGMTLRQGLRSPVYLRLIFTGVLYTLVVPAMTINFMAIQIGGGIDPIKAGGIAALVGIAAVTGRLLTGFLVDRFNGARIGAVAFLLPPIACMILLLRGVDAGSATVAGILIGLAYGAELDVFAYLTTRYFGLRNFGSLFGGILFSLSLGAGLGPVLASHIFDTFGNYTGFMWLTVLVALMCSACFMSLPKPGLLETE